MIARGAQSETFVTFDTVGATGATACAREALREPHDAANWACPVGTEFFGKNTLFVAVRDAKTHSPSVRRRGPHPAADDAPESKTRPPTQENRKNNEQKGCAEPEVQVNK